MISIFWRVTKFGLLLTALVLVAALRLAFMVRWTLYATLAFLLLLSLLLPSLLIMFIPSTFKRPVSSWKALNLRKTLLMASSVRVLPLFFFNDPATTEIYTLSLHDALPISARSACPWSPSYWCSGSAGRTGATRRGGNRSSQSTSPLRGSFRPRRARS